ncbi:MAG TPA: DNA alkylation repair protein [Gammaproteobacteria bacterium]
MNAREAPAHVAEIEQELQGLADPESAERLARYFKTGPGEYGEGDRFLGIRVPVLRKLARKHASLGLPGCRALLVSPYHEARMLALLLLVQAYDRGDEALREAIYRLYLDHTACVNNWDLVDSSAECIVGPHLENREKTVLYDLTRSTSVWERRIAIMATFCYVKAGSFDETLRVADMLLQDTHDLIHKAVGWMLREVGKRDRATAEAFLRPRYRRMPRTMLRYAIEKYPDELRRRYLYREPTPAAAPRAPSSEPDGPNRGSRASGDRRTRSRP